MSELERVVRERGAVLEEECPATGFRVEGGGVTSVETPRGPIAAKEILLATGAWSPQLGKRLGLRIPVQPGKGYSLTMAPPPAGPRIPMLLRERRMAVTPWGSGFRLGGTMEFAGYDDRLDPVRLAALMRGAALYLKGPLPADGHEAWTGWRPMTPDDLPILGRAPGLANVTLAVGHNMLGTTLAAGTGLVISELITGRASSVDLAPFAVTRFGG